MPDRTTMSLQQYCLNVVMSNIKKFLKLYRDGKFVDDIEFLQRFYSDDLFAYFLEKKLLKDAHLPFLMNRHMTTLCLAPIFNDINMNIVIKRLKVMGQSMTHVDLRNKDVSEDLLLRIIPYIPNVKKLYLPNWGATDAVVQKICECCLNISVLHVPSMLVSTTELRGLVRQDDKGHFLNTKLTELVIQRTSAKESDLIFLLTSCPNLQVLDHNQLVKSLYNMHKKDVPYIFKHPIPKYKLELLSMFEFSGKSEVIELIAAMCPSVKSLIIQNIHQHSILDFVKFEQLDSVELYSSAGIDYVPFIAAKGCSLTKIKLGNGSISLKVLKKCQKLEDLTLSHVKFTNSGFVSLRSAGTTFINLADMTLAGIDLRETDTLIAVQFILLNCPNLVNLTFLRCHSFTQNMFPFLLECASIRNTHQICFNGLDLDFLTAQRFLISVKNYKTVSIIGCEILDAELENLNDFVRHENLRLQLIVQNVEVGLYHMLHESFRTSFL